MKIEHFKLKRAFGQMPTFAPAHFLILLLLSLPSRLVALDLDPVRVGGYDTSGFAWRVAVSGNYAYVADEEAGLQAIDISNPANPKRVGGTVPAASFWRVAVSGNYAYVADELDGLHVLDVSNPAIPQQVGGYSTSGGAQDVAVSGNYAYVANDDAGLQVIDVSNPASPLWVGGYDTSGAAWGVAVWGNYTFVADYDAGLQVIDVSIPFNPQRVGRYETSWLKGYSFETPLPPGLRVQGVVLADHLRSLDWRTRRAEFICAAPIEVVEDVTAKVQALISAED